MCNVHDQYEVDVFKSRFIFLIQYQTASGVCEFVWILDVVIVKVNWMLCGC